MYCQKIFNIKRRNEIDMSDKLKVLDLFAGTKSMSKAFEKRGHETFAIEWDEVHEDIDWYVDILEVTAKDIIQKFGRPDIIWCSPDCKSYSIAGITHHRRKQEDGSLKPISDYAVFCDKVNAHVIELVKELNPMYYFIENPRGGLRKMNFMQDLPRYTVTYCQYSDTRMKPTDVFTNHPNPKFKPMCKNGDPCHVSAPRGSQTGTAGLKGAIERSRIPDDLCNHIVDISEEAFRPWEELNIDELAHRKEHLLNQAYAKECDNEFTRMEVNEINILMDKLR